jgi:hypothetical protein
MSTTGLGSTGGTFSGNLNSTGLGFSGIPSASGTFGGIGYGGGLSGSSSGLNSSLSAARFAGISNSNLFSSYYASPLAGGLSTSGTATQGRFGQPLFTLNATTNTTGMSGIGLGRGTGTATTTMGAGMAGYGSTTSSYIRPGISQIGPVQVGPVLARNLQPRADLQQVIARSSSLASKNSIQVLSDGNVIVLRGTVGSEYEREFAERLVRLSPGTANLRNELTVGASAPIVK